MLKLLGKWLLVAGGVLGGLYLAATLAGLTMPSQIDVTASVIISRPAENVWWVLTDYNSAALWQPQYKDARMTSAPGDRPVRWRATYTDGYVANFEVKDNNFPTHLREEIADTNLPFAGGWTVDLARTGEVCKVTVQSHAVLHRPIDRLFVRWFVRPSAEMEKILASLKRRVEATTVKPTPATS